MSIPADRGPEQLGRGLDGRGPRLRGDVPAHPIGTQPIPFSERVADVLRLGIPSWTLVGEGRCREDVQVGPVPGEGGDRSTHGERPRHGHDPTGDRDGVEGVEPEQDVLPRVAGVSLQHDGRGRDTGILQRRCVGIGLASTVGAGGAARDDHQRGDPPPVQARRGVWHGPGPAAEAEDRVAGLGRVGDDEVVPEHSEGSIDR